MALLQGDAEKNVGMPISAFMDRTTPNVPKCQSGFIQFIAMPTYLLDSLFYLNLLF